jgi:hypothetical protein
MKQYEFLCAAATTKAMNSFWLRDRALSFNSTAAASSASASITPGQQALSTKEVRHESEEVLYRLNGLKGRAQVNLVKVAHLSLL